MSTPAVAKSKASRERRAIRSLKWVNRFQILLFFVVCISLLFLQAKKCWDRYAKNETGVAMEIVSSRNTTFPDFTICPYYFSSYKTDFLEAHGTSFWLYKQGRFTEALPEGTDMREFHDQATHDIDEVIRWVIVQTVDTEGVRIDPEHNGTMWKTHRHVTYGRCYTLTVPERVVKQGIVEMVFYFHNNPYVYIHHPGQFAYMDSKSKLEASYSKKMFIDLIYELTYLHTNEDPNEGFVCSETTDFGFDGCLYDAVGDIIADKYGGCTAPFLPDSHREVCEYSKFNTTAQMGFNADFRKKIFDNQTELCPAPCAALTDTKGFPSYGEYDNNNRTMPYSYIKMYFKRNVKIRRSIYTYGIVSMLAEIGGYTGLLLGFSCFHISGVIAKIIRSMDQ